ncbi:MAG: ABC transporter ATP-binding protein, partial [Eubacteriaceae bacterium]|nr:ABC transporter ATP-binding protein [Eubacteriaceae bacterium]
VCFSYPGSDSEVLHDISFSIAPGETIGIMGATGSGKTILAHLIPRLYDATKGTVLVGGKDVREYSLRQLRDHISLAFQKPQIFSESIRENISWGKQDAPEEDIRNAGYISRADEFIDDMPAGYDSMLEERGMNLSGGQKQRVALARAVIRDSGILILDDATSALDLSTEAEFYERLEGARAGLTRIIIAQRIASVSSADRLIIMDGGRIADMGTHSELMERCSIYRDIYESQLGEEEANVR